ncbi:VWA domain-containing protein [Thermomonospora cellulosilytica]|uniref:Mg-chelatase subunit ChlD n=1 Tax=Thermomonospora cellulosilytica TaxID=1411118 RepID=A0A7W3R8B5_9ACTN|nr:VWA domain-containing protein [Thermomonospora cellulosilytica]MBA9003511.1 Mg-chelatase subunit ChlD [Thermomonospora cellulosilytica]
MTGPDPGLERWRLVLGEAAEECLGGLGDRDAARDRALDWLYGRDSEYARRGIRRGGGRGRDAERDADLSPSQVTPVDWLDDVHRLFPKETIERLERDAVERYGIHEVVTDPAVLGRIEPNPTLLRAVLRTKHLMNPDVLAMARRIVAAVVKELTERLATEVRRSFHGTRSRRPSPWRSARDFDFHRTIRANLGHYRPDERRLYIERPYFLSRTRRRMERWQLILLVDQSGSMAGSVIHSAVTAACLWGLPGLKTHLVAFDTSVVDLTDDVTDPVELLMGVQLGGGTDIARAVGYAADLVDNPRRAIVAVISDFYEGGDEHRLVRTVRGMVEQGTRVLALAALDEDAEPEYDRELAQRLADVGAHVGAMTPGQLVSFVADVMG